MVLDVVRIKGRWQDDYFLRTGHLATLKGASNEKCTDSTGIIYETAPTEEEREKARQEYLDRRGIPEDFRW